MTAGELAEQLKGIPKESILVVSGPDHSYKRAVVDFLTAIQYGQELTEDFGAAHNEPGGKKVFIALFS